MVARPLQDKAQAEEGETGSLSRFTPPIFVFDQCSGRFITHVKHGGGLRNENVLTTPESILIRFTQTPSTCPLAFPLIYISSSGAGGFLVYFKDYVKHHQKLSFELNNPYSSM